MSLHDISPTVFVASNVMLREYLRCAQQIVAYSNRASTRTSSSRLASQRVQMPGPARCRRVRCQSSGSAGKTLLLGPATASSTLLLSNPPGIERIRYRSISLGGTTKRAGRSAIVASPFPPHVIPVLQSARLSYVLDLVAEFADP